MAAKKKVAKKAPAKKVATKGKTNNLPKVEAPKYGVPALAKALDVTEFHTRNKLRDLGGKADKYKSGRSYDFGSADGVKEVVALMSA